MRKLGGVFLVLFLFLAEGWSHATFYTQGPLYMGRRTTLTLYIPNEQMTDVTGVTLQVPEDFLLSGGRLEKIEVPAGWEFAAERQPKPEHILAEDLKRAEERQARFQSTQAANSPEERAREESERKQRQEQLRSWIKKVSFQGGHIPRDGFVQFALQITLPRKRGRFYFPVVEHHEGGQTVAWSALDEQAERPAAFLVVQARYGLPHYALLAAVVALLALLLRPGRRYKRWRSAVRESPSE